MIIFSLKLYTFLNYKVEQTPAIPYAVCGSCRQAFNNA